MKIKLPKNLRGFAYDRVLPVDLNNFDVDILLPSIFFKIVSEGRDRGRRANDPTMIRDYVEKLARHPVVDGFADEHGLRLMDRLVRTSLIHIGQVGRARRGEQIEGLTSHTYLTFKAGFPAEGSRLRKVDGLLYRMIEGQMRGEKPARDFFERVFGRGLIVNGGAEPDGRYDGQTDLDTITRLSICLLDGMQSTGVRPAKERPSREPCPALSARMARDFRRYLEAYRERMPTEALTYHFQAMINFELFTYSMKLFYAITELVGNPEELPIAMRRALEPSPPEIYVDFTGSATGPSREMATACVRRDVEAIQRFIVSNLVLRWLDRYTHQMRGDRRVGAIVTTVLGNDEGGPEYLQGLMRLRSDSEVSLRIDAAAQRDEDAIRDANRPPEADDDLNRTEEALDRVVATAASDFDRTIALLAESQGVEIMHHAVA